MKSSFNRRFNVVLSLILAFAMVIGITPASTFAYNEEEGRELVDIFYEEIVDEYYDDLYAFVYDQAVEYGLFDEAIAEIDDLIAQLEEVKTKIPEDVPEEIPEELPEDWPDEIPENWLEQIPEDLLDKIPEDLLQDLIDRYGSGNGSAAAVAVVADEDTSNPYTEYVAYVNKIREEVDTALDTLNELKDILEGDDFATYEDMRETVDYVQEMLPERLENIQLLWILLAEETDSELDADMILDVLDTIEKVEYELENTVAPAVDEALEVVAAVVYDPACKLLEIFLEQDVDSAEKIRDAIEEISNMSEDEIKARLEEIIYDATHHEYVIDDESLLVAFGNITARESYVKLLANELGIEARDHSLNSLTIKQMVENFANYQADIAEADLITLNFAEVDSLLKIIENAVAYGADYDMDWSLYLDADSMDIKAELDALIADAYSLLEEQGVEQKYAETVVKAVEYYLYNCVSYGVELDRVVSKIRAVNPNAVVVVVGPYNPLNNTTFDYNDTTIAVGDYVDYLYAVLGVYDLVYAVLTEDITYVNPTDVEVVLGVTELTEDVLADITSITLMPSSAGHQTLKQEIYDALIITADDDDETDDPECTHNWEWVVDEEENCGEPGSKHEECSVCHAVRNENTVIPATGNHTWEWVVDEEENCGEPGSKHEECSVCHAVRNENTEIPATGNHTWEWVIDQEASETEPGSKHEECSVCHAVRNENTEIPATGSGDSDLEQTGDSVFDVVVIALAMFSASAGALAIFVSRRRHFIK